MYADLINALLELTGAGFILMNCRAAYRDKDIKGVSPVSTAFFTLWGGWNMYYYPSLGQWFSFAGAVCLFAANVLWIALMLRYLRQKALAASATGQAAPYVIEPPAVSIPMAGKVVIPFPARRRA